MIVWTSYTPGENQESPEMEACPEGCGITIEYNSSDPKRLSRHRKTHAQCKACHVLFADKYNLKKHMKDRHGFACSMAGCRFKSEKKSDAKRHIQSQHIQCVDCNFQARSGKDFASHIRKLHRNESMELVQVSESDPAELSEDDQMIPAQSNNGSGTMTKELLKESEVDKTLEKMNEHVRKLHGNESKELVQESESDPAELSEDEQMIPAQSNNGSGTMTKELLKESEVDKTLDKMNEEIDEAVDDSEEDPENNEGNDKAVDDSEEDPENNEEIESFKSPASGLQTQTTQQTEQTPQQTEHLAPAGGQQTQTKSLLTGFFLNLNLRSGSQGKFTLVFYF